MFKKIIIILTIILIISIPNFAEENVDNTNLITKNPKETKLKIQSKCGIIFDRASKSIIWGKNENERVPMASTTKIMTAIILLENVQNLKQEIAIVKEAARVGGSSLELNVGDKITYESLLYGLLLCSGNDAAVQIAISVGGNVEHFIELMNKKAKELNLVNTNFVTPHGLDKEEHYTTAFELAKLADYALNIEKFADVVSTKKYTIFVNGYPRLISNTNELLGNLNGVNGIKTGFTNGAGRCLVTSVNRKDFEIITVVLGADTKKMRTNDSIRMVEYVYENYELSDIGKIANEEFKNWKMINEKRIKVIKGKTDKAEVGLEKLLYEKYPIIKGKEVKCEFYCNKYFLEAPISTNTEVGYIKITALDPIELKITIQEEIKRKKVLDYFKQFLGSLT